MKRREFLYRSALTTVGGLLVPNFLKAFEKEQLYKKALGDKILVIIQLSGGNDGLNTVIPHYDDNYYKLRPRLAIAKEQVFRLNDEQGLHPALGKLKALYDQGYLSIIQNVGYPNPDRSHFRSMDIWHTASDAKEYLSSGWIGRLFDAQCDKGCKPYTAIELDDTLSLALKGEKVNGLALQDPQKFYRLTRGKHLENIAQQAHADHEHENVAYLYKTLAETVSSADYIYEKAKIQKSTLTYPQGNLSRRLQTIAQMMQSGIDTSIYYASLSGFDTHVNQAPQQQRLLEQYAESVYAFVEDLKKSGYLDRTLILTFSEFGRRVAQNASNGTDHGTANNIFIIGGKLKKAGFYNGAPNLTDLDNGDLKYQVDFRQVYATVLQKHLQVDPSSIITESFKALDFV